MRMRKLAVLSLLLLGCTRVLAQEKTEALHQNPEQSFFHRTQFSITDSLADDEMVACPAAQHAEPRGRKGNHVPSPKRLVRTDDAFPHAEPRGPLVRPRLLAHRDRSPRQATPSPLRRIHLFAQTGLLDPARIHRIRRRNTAQRQHEHHSRCHRLLCSQRPVEHRIRTDQDQGQPGPHQLVECPAVRRPQHREQPVQP